MSRKQTPHLNPSNFGASSDGQWPNIVILTGAGISAESGLKTFRDNDGLWEEHALEEVATPEAFSRNPELVYRFYNQRREQLQSADVQPNAAHIALAKLESAFPENVLIITQNVDDLHERAGSKNVLHMHGELLSARCNQSHRRFIMKRPFDGTSRCQCCSPSQTIRPDIVWFGEMPFHMEEIECAVQEADVFISIGTSGNVYPAAGLVQIANHYGAHTVELNLAPSEGNNDFLEAHYGLASAVVPHYLTQYLKGK
ncbi:NAD-dependent protein deacylase [Paraglaciecola mesophila]|uniref:NAD-dependent protein deacylase n=1 Tax=Paraglaciecola mesophila TaxID=197222 RepID=A0A857JGH3_9ALTE|nr:Sir2 family NAD+-dependent deacetylase [Paraglaciecola mesophila]QHJ10298.1 NAD-dependent protein deacylase [Paraglaciecola mesophila]